MPRTSLFGEAQSLNHLDFLRKMIDQGGPKPEEDQQLSAAILRLYLDVQAQRITDLEIETLREQMNLTPETMHGFTYLKPNGYAGCYEICINRIYQCYHSQKSELYHWDRYWQSHPAAQAVRNRKDYFIQLIRSKVTTGSSLQVLNVASGPSRDLNDLFTEHPDLPIQIHCIEQDERAIEYASRLCEPHLDKITFHQRNALRFSLPETFDLVWSAGLFDYLNDGLFTKLIRRLAKQTKPGGEIVIGNFSLNNPSRAYMELFEWNLIHRSEQTLLQLALESGVQARHLTVDSEPLGVNNFLHIQMA